MRRKLSVCLSLLLVAALLSPVSALCASAASRTPVINIEGEREIEVWKEDGTHYSPTEDAADAVVDEAVKELVPLFLKAMLTNNYDEWSRRALEKLTPIYDEIRPYPDGSLPENTHPYFPPYGYGGATEVQAPGQVNFYYTYDWDFRRSPLDEADDLHHYIELIKEKTGSDRVTLASRCGSTALAAAYIYKYGTEDIEKLIFTCPTLPGVSYADSLLSGNLFVSGSALYNYVSYGDALSSLNEKIGKFVTELLYAMAQNGSIDDANVIISRAYGKIKDSFVAPFLRSYYGICGNYITDVGEHYEDYRDYVFPTQELKTEYASILEKADEYHYNVQEKIEELLTGAKNAGVSVNFIVTYGEPAGYPIGENSAKTGDELMDVTSQSLGATTGNYGETLSDSYIAERTDAGFGKYISPDKQIDASTGLFPDTTWFIKNIRHNFMVYRLHDLIRLIAWTDGMTVETNPAYPQFLTIAGDDYQRLEPAQAVNENDVDSAPAPDMNGVSGFFARIIAFFVGIYVRIAKLFNSLSVG
ncbi:MAG: hypothetical protein IJS90_10295 [Clostridia bacterium]|nr:hypothetical protein [Clostridia bacterium]